MPRPFELQLPKRPRRSWIAIAASIVAHTLLLFGWVSGRLPDVPRLPRQLIVLAPPADGPDHVTTPYRVPQPSAERERPQSRRPTPGRRPDRPEFPAPPEAVKVLPTPQTPALAREDTGSAARTASAVARVARIGPGLADGRLWVRPLPLPPRDLAQRLSRSHTELVDSAVTAIVQAYLDSIASDPATRNAGLPSWTTEIAGKKFGLDSKNIYIAGLKIPAAVLALLPISAANIDQNRAYNRLMDMRSDLLYAAQRAQTMEEFKQIIREIRLRKERERELERNQRTAPPPEEPATP